MSAEVKEADVVFDSDPELVRLLDAVRVSGVLEYELVPSSESEKLSVAVAEAVTVAPVFVTLLETEGADRVSDCTPVAEAELLRDTSYVYEWEPVGVAETS